MNREKKLHKSVIIDRCEVSAESNTESLPNHNHHLEDVGIFLFFIRYHYS